MNLSESNLKILYTHFQSHAKLQQVTSQRQALQLRELQLELELQLRLLRSELRRAKL